MNASSRARSSPQRPDLVLLSELADAASQGHTPAAIARGVAEVLRRQAPVLRFELARCSDGRSEVVTLVPQGADWGVTQRRQPLSRPAVLAAMSHRKVFVGSELRAHPERAAVPFIDAEQVAALGVGHVVALTFGESQGGWGYAVAYLASGESSWALLRPGLLEAWSHILQLAHRNAVLIDRVATVSRRAHRENKRLRSQLEAYEPAELVVASPVMRRILDQVDRVAAHDTTVLLQGESGTGKELLAQRIHEHSPRRAGPFLQLNCGALPEGLIESELFGHEKGAFTGAGARHAGSFERAHGGTLLLDEVGDLPLLAQVKLLRVLQEGRYERVGGELPLEVDVRVIAATHRALEEMVEAGRFRADLYYRLSVFPVRIPPLRERPDDLRPLVSWLLPRIARRLGRTEPALSSAAWRWLMDHAWPGNVRELENRLERALILARGDRLEVVDLGEPTVLGGSAPVGDAKAGPPGPLEEAVRAAIRTALRYCEGRIYGSGGAAELLGLKPSTLQSKMRKLGIRRGEFASAEG